MHTHCELKDVVSWWGLVNTQILHRQFCFLVLPSLQWELNRRVTISNPIDRSIDLSAHRPIIVCVLVYVCSTIADQYHLLACNTSAPLFLQYSTIFLIFVLFGYRISHFELFLDLFRRTIAPYHIHHSTNCTIFTSAKASTLFYSVLLSFRSSISKFMKQCFFFRLGETQRAVCGAERPWVPRELQRHCQDDRADRLRWFRNHQL